MITSRFKSFVPYLLIGLLAIVIGLTFAKGLLIVPGALLGVLIFALFLWFCISDLKSGVVLFLFTLPFERIPSLHAGGVTVRLSQVALAALLIAYLLERLGKGSFKMRITPYFFVYILFLISVLASFWQMVAISRGIQVFVFMLFTSFTIWLIPAIITTKQDLKRSVLAVFISTILISIFGLYQFVGDIIGLPTSVTGLRELYTKVVFGFPRVQSTSLEPLYLANFLLIPLSLAITYAVRRSREFSWRIYASIIGLGGLVFVLTLSRGGYVGLAASLCFIGLLSLFWLLRPTVVLGGMAIALFVIVTVAGLANFSDLGQKSIDETTKHFTKIGQDASTLQRFSTFDSAREAFRTKPITGVGIGNFGPYVANYPSQLPIDGWAIVNNAPLEILAETGIFGLISTILFLIVLVGRSIGALFTSKDPFLRTTLLGLLAALVGILTQYQFFSTFYIMHIWTLFALLIAVQNIIFKEAQS